MTTNVLVAPVGPSITDETYGKEYYLLQHVARAAPDYQFEAYAQQVHRAPPEPNVLAHALTPNATRTWFRLALFNTVRKQLRGGDFDVYHHVKLSFLSINPILAGGLGGDVPTVIGPAYPPHMVDRESVRNFVRKTTGFNAPQSTVDAALPLIHALRDGSNLLRRPLFARTLRGADRVVVIDEETADLYAKYVPRSKLEVLPFGVDLDRFTIGDPAAARDVVAIGMHIERKGFGPLLEAWSAIAEEFPDTKLQIYGDGPRRTLLERRAQELGLTDSVVFNGYVDHETIREALATARAFVHPTLSEAQAHVRLEAMASACPVIASEIRGTREMVRDGTDGITVPVGAVAPLADAIRTLLEDPELAKGLGLSARKQAERKYDWRKIGARLVEIYEEVQR